MPLGPEPTSHLCQDSPEPAPAALPCLPDKPLEPSEPHFPYLLSGAYRGPGPPPQDLATHGTCSHTLVMAQLSTWPVMAPQPPPFRQEQVPLSTPVTARSSDALRLGQKKSPDSQPPEGRLQADSCSLRTVLRWPGSCHRGKEPVSWPKFLKIFHSDSATPELRARLVSLPLILSLPQKWLTTSTPSRGLVTGPHSPGQGPTYTVGPWSAPLLARPPPGWPLLAHRMATAPASVSSHGEFQEAKGSSTAHTWPQRPAPPHLSTRTTAQA